MSKVLKSSNKLLMSGGRWLTREYVPPEPPPPPPMTRYVHLNQSTGGTISASPMSGVDGDTVTLSNSPSTNYTFNGYSVNGATLYSGNKFDFSGSDVTCSASWTYVPPQPTWVELVNKEGVENTVPPGYGHTVYIGDKMTGGTSYRYVTLRADVKFDPSTSSIHGDNEFSLQTLQDDYYYWRVRYSSDSNYIGAVGIYGGVTAFTPASSTVRSFVSDGVTYYYKTSWRRTSQVYKNVKLVYDTQANTCELYIDSTLWGTATVNYSPHSIYGARIGHAYGETMGTDQKVYMKDLKAAAFQNLADARAY